jgi:hypothetical protein
MLAVASADQTEALSAADRAGIASGYRMVFGGEHLLDLDALELTTPVDLAAAIGDPDLRLNVVRVLAVMALVDGVVDQRKLQDVLAFAAALEVQQDFVQAVHELVQDHVAWVAFDEIRHNVETIPKMPWVPDDPYAAFLPYGSAPDPDLAERYQQLGELPSDRFGRAFHDHYTRNGFAFAGDPLAVNEVWATAHDSLHVLSGYGTSAQGELLVAAYTGAQLQPPRDGDPMESHVLPTILIYHLGIVLNKGLNSGDRERAASDPTWRDNYSGNVHLGLDPEKLWVAWDRGGRQRQDLYDPSWDFWSLVEVPTEELRERYSILPLPEQHAAVADDLVDRDAFVREGQPPPPEISGEHVAER